jgi:RNA polymerase sigma factor (TIGR02999 family)
VFGSARDITTLLELDSRDPSADEELFRLVKGRFQAIAAALMWKERPDASVQATMLVDDAFLQLIRRRNQQWSNRGEFFGQAAKTMRRLLIDHARERNAVKRGGGERPAALHVVGEPAAGGASDPESLVELGEVLERLETAHPEVFRVFDLHYFMQYDLQEIADDILDVSYTTVRRRWKMARAFLRQELIGDEQR